MCKILACKQHRQCNAFRAVGLFLHFVLLFLCCCCSWQWTPHYMIHITLFSTAALKKKNETVFFAIMLVRPCVCILCRHYQLCLCHAVPNEHIRPVSVCDERQTSLQWVAVAGQCGRHAGVCIVHTQTAHIGNSQPGLCRFLTDSDKDSVVYTCKAECAAREQSRSNS